MVRNVTWFFQAGAHVRPVSVNQWYASAVGSGRGQRRGTGRVGAHHGEHARGLAGEATRPVLVAHGAQRGQHVGPH
jgi:hypothetical protein